MSGHWLYSIAYTVLATIFTLPVSPVMAGVQALVGLVAVLVRLARPHRNLLLVQMTAQMVVLLLGYGGCGQRG